MDAIKNFIIENGLELLSTIVVAVVGYIGVELKKLYQKYVNDKTKEAVAKTCVKAVEQLYKDLHGEEKLNKALESARDMLVEKGITVTDLELRILIESAVAEFNKAFEKNKLSKLNDARPNPDSYYDPPVPDCDYDYEVTPEDIIDNTIQEETIENVGVTFTAPKNKIGFAINNDERKNE